jgi:hypothetical protein
MNPFIRDFKHQSSDENHLPVPFNVSEFELINIKHHAITPGYFKGLIITL